MPDISLNIKKNRIAQGLSQTQLADKVGVTRQTISSWENGASFPDVKMLEKIASVLNTGIDELLYPQSRKARKHFVMNPLSFKFVIISVVVYFVLLIWGGGLVAVPLLKKLVGGGVNEEFVLVVYWGLILLVCYIAIFACVISDYMSYCYERFPCGSCLYRIEKEHSESEVTAQGGFPNNPDELGQV